MRQVDIDARLKPLYANLKRLHIGRYLYTEHFELFVLERNWDNIWIECKRVAGQGRTMFGLVSLEEEEREVAFAYFLGIVFGQWHQKKPFDPNYFGTVIFPVLGRFVRWNSKSPNLTRVYKCLADLGAPSEQIERFSSETEKFLQARPKPAIPIAMNDAPNHAVDNKMVFVVHGHNKAIQLEVSAVLVKAGLTPVVLHERANSGQTIIEKFEKNADVGAAIVLLTADDFGRAKAEKKLKPRARQNVILELGYFIGKLGRKRVIPLYEQGVELPSDFNGVGYDGLDSAGRWRFQVIKELQAMGYAADANNIL